jgi:hypothetical protein
MYYSKLKRYATLISFFVLLISVYSCKKDEASPTSSDVISATSTAETKALLETYTWRGIAYRTAPGARPVDAVGNVFLYRFIDTTGTIRINNVGSVSPFYAEYHLTTPTGVLMIKRNAAAVECRGIYSIDGNKITIDNPSGRYVLSGTYYCLFKDTLAYINDYPSLTPTDKYHSPAANVPMMTFSKQ